MTLDRKILDYFQPILVKRTFGQEAEISLENEALLTTVGMPNGILDFDFTGDLYWMSEAEIVIGTMNNQSPVVLETNSGYIVNTQDNIFLAKTLSNFIRQLYAYDSLWDISIKNADLGNYREDENHKKYAELLKNELLAIDPDLLTNDNGYYWGSLIEDIELGVVG